MGEDFAEEQKMPKSKSSVRGLRAGVNRGDGILMICFFAIIAVALAAHLLAGWSS